MRLLFYIYSGQYYQLFSLEKKKKVSWTIPKTVLYASQKSLIVPICSGDSLIPKHLPSDSPQL